MELDPGESVIIKSSSKDKHGNYEGTIEYNGVQYIEMNVRGVC